MITQLTAHAPATNTAPWSNLIVKAGVGIVATALCSLTNPITGVAVGTYFIVEVTTEALLICSYKETLLKVLQTFVPLMSGVVASSIARGVLTGTFAVIPMVISTGVGAALSILVMRWFYPPEENEAAWRQFKDFWCCKKS